MLTYSIDESKIRKTLEISAPIRANQCFIRGKTTVTIFLVMLTLIITMLFDIYFSLGSFYLGLCAAFACTSKALGPVHAVAMGIGLLILSLCQWIFRWHMQHHCQQEAWSLRRKIFPLVAYSVGFALPLLAS